MALPDIGKAFDASQTQLDLVAVGYSLGLAASVLYFGAIGDRYGRKRMLVLGTLFDEWNGAITSATSETANVPLTAASPVASRSQHPPVHRIARGFTGEPVPPTTLSGAVRHMNSHRRSDSQAPASPSSCR